MILKFHLKITMIEKQPLNIQLDKYQKRNYRLKSNKKRKKFVNLKSFRTL